MFKMITGKKREKSKQRSSVDATMKTNRSKSVHLWSYLKADSFSKIIIT